MQTGKAMHSLATELFPLPRSITGDGVRATLKRLRLHLPDLQINEMPNGTQCFDWVVPREWNCRDAWIITPEGERIADFRVNTLHVLNYSVSVDMSVSLDL